MPFSWTGIVGLEWGWVSVSFYMPIGLPLFTDMDHVLMLVFTLCRMLYYEFVYHAVTIGQ